ncbi:hypothetical protein V9K67_25220 [Paraflavisolibacter sp. H34]|uniref:hypothetical protein n=1 Tax=Huijunlia imazamoxiresistens TaxID=3127457 RepID=UPI00301598AD
MKFRIYTSWIQGIYTFLTAVWPIVDIESFLKVSGYKTDIWLVKTVSLLLLSISLCLLLSIFSKGPYLPITVLMLTLSVSLAYVDFYYALNDTISNIYMADGAAQVVFTFCWLYILARKK